MLGTFRKKPDELAAFARIEGFVRARFGLATTDQVLVTELMCKVPGCPPLETVIAFWTADGTRHHVKVFKRAVEVVCDDLPPAWYRPALVVDDNASMDCGC